MRSWLLTMAKQLGTVLAVETIDVIIVSTFVQSLYLCVQGTERSAMLATGCSQSGHGLVSCSALREKWALAT